MKIEFLTQDDPLYILPFFDEFFRHFASDFEIKRMSCCRAMGRRSRIRLLKEVGSLYGNIGTLRLIGRMAASRLLGSLPRSRNSTRFHSLTQLCRAYGVRYEPVANPNAKAFVAAMADRAPDLIVSVACPYILKEPLLKLPPLGCINIHHAPLPRYKGMMPTFWQMYHGEKKVGVTVHYMAPKVDEGPALLQDELEIEPGEVLDHLIRRSKRHGAHCVGRVLHQLASGTHTATPLNKTEGSYFTFPTLDEIREFRRRGFQSI